MSRITSLIIMIVIMTANYANAREEGNNHEIIKYACLPIANSTHLVELNFSVY
jgi:hypothetical protein